MLARDRQRASMGRVLFCPEFNDTLDALGAALSTAEGLSLTDKQSYVLAKAFYDRQSGFWSGDWVAIGSGCTDDVTQGTQLLNNLNADIQSAGGASTPVPASASSASSTNFLGINFTPILWAAGIGVVGFIAFQVWQGHKLKRLATYVR